MSVDGASTLPMPPSAHLVLHVDMALLAAALVVAVAAAIEVQPMRAVGLAQVVMGLTVEGQAQLLLSAALGVTRAPAIVERRAGMQPGTSLLRRFLTALSMAV